jgi:hypothetical protein
MPKTNREKLNAMTDQELAELFCKTMEDIADKTKDDDWCCDLCPVSKICKAKHNGFLKWLEKEAEG